MALESRLKEIDEWHQGAFPAATPRDIAAKLIEESEELYYARNRSEMADEIADCAICIFALAARCGFDLDAEIERKFQEVRGKYPCVV